MYRTTFLFSICCVLFVFCGCTNSNPQGRLEIVGDVSLGGQPVSSGSIEFEPSGSQSERTQSGAIITDGKYTIPAEKGLVAGEYRVRISVMEEVAGSKKENADPMLASAQYVDLAPPDFGSQTKQKVTVEKGKENKFDFKM